MSITVCNICRAQGCDNWAVVCYAYCDYHLEMVEEGQKVKLKRGPWSDAQARAMANMTPERREQYLATKKARDARAAARKRSAYIPVAKQREMAAQAVAEALEERPSRYIPPISKSKS